MAEPEIFQQTPADDINDLSRANFFLKQIVHSHDFCQSPQGVTNWVSLHAILNIFNSTCISTSSKPITSLF